MKTLFNSIAILLLFAFFTSCQEERISGSGRIVEEHRTHSSFDKISQSGEIDLEVYKSNTFKIILHADNNIIGKIRTRVVNDQLLIYMDDDYRYSNYNAYAEVWMPEIRTLENDGTSNIFLNNFDNNASLKINNEGTGDITLSGDAHKLTVKNSGTGRIKAMAFPVYVCDVKSEGTGDLEITAFNRIKGYLAGTGNIYYKGSPIVDLNITGTGRIISLN